MTKTESFDSENYALLVPGDVFQVKGSRDEHKVLAVLTIPGESMGMSNTPTITRIVLSTGAVISFDPWVENKPYRILRHEDLTTVKAPKITKGRD